MTYGIYAIRFVYSCFRDWYKHQFYKITYRKQSFTVTLHNFSRIRIFGIHREKVCQGFYITMVWDFIIQL